MPKQETDQSTLNETEIMGLFDSRASMYGLLAGLYAYVLETTTGMSTGTAKRQAGKCEFLLELRKREAWSNSRTYTHIFALRHRTGKTI